jgi:hypothetical protein
MLLARVRPLKKSKGEHHRETATRCEAF